MGAVGQGPRVDDEQGGVPLPVPGAFPQRGVGVLERGRDGLVPADLLQAERHYERRHLHVHSEWRGEPDRLLPNQRIVAYPTARGCAAAYYPEANVLVPLESAAEESNTPVSKAVIVRLVPHAAS